ncbi:hypothetical protein FGRMN_10109 [Fusarium graminum]|nr:hypothetical protein FGRMN_10109 [Fusarium graminum]
MHQDYPEDLPVSVKIRPAGIISGYYLSKSRSIRPLLHYRVFYLNGTLKPAWNFIKPGNFFLKSRRDEYQPLLTGWINDCNSHHKGCTDQNTRLPKRVLDVGTEKTKHVFLHVSSGEPAPYVALSHCWGSTGIRLKTTKSTIKDHQRAISFQELPKNFQDAVVITRSIGIRYLWIDSLCIVQDDTEDWQVESSKMSYIYHSAYLVLAASQAANSDEGFLDRRQAPTTSTLYQIRVRDEPVRIGQIRNLDSTVSKIYVQSLGLSRHGTELRHHSTAVYSPLNRRAWVLQENILPSRIVHFTCHEMLWECIECLKCECMEVDQTPPLRGESRNLVRNEQFFSFRTPQSFRTQQSSNKLHGEWLGLLEEYHQLALSNQSDRLPALSGLASLWASRGAGAYLAGLWQDNVLRSIMWKSSQRRGSIRRWETYRAPSWSPFALGYLTDDQEPVAARFKFPTDYQDISQMYAKVVDAQCTPDGKDKMGAVKDGYLVLQTLVTEVHPDNRSIINDSYWRSDWDRGIEDADGREVVLILIGYFDMSRLNDGTGVLRPRSIIAVPSKTVAGAYERIGISTPHEGEPAGTINRLFEEAETRRIKLV